MSLKALTVPKIKEGAVRQQGHNRDVVGAWQSAVYINERIAMSKNHNRAGRRC